MDYSELAFMAAVVTLDDSEKGDPDTWPFMVKQLEAQLSGYLDGRKAEDLGLALVRKETHTVLCAETEVN